MPLIHKKSKKAFEHNLKAELGAGKPKDQSLAIAYSVQRKGAKKKMAMGGHIAEEVGKKPEADMEPHMPKEHENEAAEHYDSIADAILAKGKKAKMLAEGGIIEENQELADEVNTSPQLEAINSGEDIENSEDQPTDSNGHGDAEEHDSENKHDMVESIRRKMKSLRG